MRPPDSLAKRDTARGLYPRVLLASALLAAPACGGARARPPSGPVIPVSNAVTLEAGRFDEISREDRVGPGDRPGPDGHNDTRFRATLSGRVSGMILTVCDGPGAHTGTQWDTIVGQDALPPGFLHRAGHETWVLGVVDPQGNMLNAGDGALPEQRFERTVTLQLFVSQQEALIPGRTVCLTVLRPDGTTATASADIGQPPD